ncbi:MAG: TPM domain-containing protein [Lentihominibacter sp.]|jgi:uncharacterized protein
MSKRFFAILVATLMIFATAVPAVGATFAYGAEKDYCIDYADQVSDDTEKKYNQTAAKLKEKYGVDVIYICTKDSEGLTNEEYADSIQKNYGANAVILIDNIEQAKIYCSSYGTASKAVNNDEIDAILNAYNENDSYTSAIEEYYDTVGGLLENAGIAPAGGNSEGDSVIPDERLKPLLVDDADLLTDSEEAELLATLEEISDRQGMDVAIATTNSFTQGTAMEAADDFYDYNGYGQGPDRDGLILYVCMDTRDIWISTCGAGINAFTDYGIEHIIDEITSDMSGGYYKDAFDTYASICDDFITRYHNGEPYDVGNTGEMPWEFMLAAIILGPIIGFVVGKTWVAGERSKLKSVEYATEATAYLKDGSLDIRDNSRVFLYTDITRVYSPKEDKSSGGSSTHTSSSGTSHGGGGGKF